MNNKQQLSKQIAQENKKLGEKLVEEARKHNLQEVKSLIEKGVDVNFVMYTGANCWYSGNTHTALYDAVHSKFQNQKNYVDVIEYLLKKGANPNFKAERGGWNHSTLYPLFSGVSYILNKFKQEDQKIRFLQMFAKHGVNLNQIERHSRSKNWRGYNDQSCFIFELMQSSGLGEKTRKLIQLQETIDYQKLSQNKEKQLRKLFLTQYNIKQDQQQNIEGEVQEQANQQQNEENNTQKKAEIKLIKQLISLGVNPNSQKNYSRWQKFDMNFQFEQEINDRQLQKYFYSTNTIQQSVIHRAIMNNQPQLVKYLIEKGANVNALYKYTVKLPSYPSQWPQKVKEIRAKLNMDKLHENQKSKEESQQQLQKLNAKLAKKQKQRQQAKSQIINNQNIQVTEQKESETNQQKQKQIAEQTGGQQNNKQNQEGAEGAEEEQGEQGGQGQNQNEQAEQNYQQVEQGEQQMKERVNDLKRNIQYYDYQIFKAQRFSIQNELPIPISTIRQLTCLQICQKLKISQQIANMIKIQLQKQNGQKIEE